MPVFLNGCRHLRIFLILNDLQNRGFYNVITSSLRALPHVSAAFGGGEALPARIIYNTNIQSGVCIPLQGMEGKQPGDSVSSSFHHRLLEY